MVIKNIDWCLNKIKLIKPNDYISEEYLKQAFEDFDMVKKVNNKWRIITAYYSCYNSVYSILMKVGIKCEIHDCTIALMKILGFENKEIEFLKNLKSERIEVQYFLKRPEISIIEISEFLTKSKYILRNMNDNKINSIRNILFN